MKENIKIPAGTESIDIETLVKFNAAPVVVPPVIPPVVTNKPPVSKAGLDVSIQGNYVVLDGKDSTDPDGTLASYKWTQVSGATAASIHNPTLSRCGIGDLKTGVYIFRLTVTDNKGATSTDDIQVTVNNPTPVTPPTDPPIIIPPTPPIVVPPISGTPVKYLQLPTGTPQMYEDKNGLLIENLRFTNKGSVNNGNILNFSGCANVTIRNCYFGSSNGCALYFFDGCSNIKIENCLFVYNKGSVIVSRSGSVYLKNCQQVNGYGSGDGDGRDGGLFKLIECKGAGLGVEGCRVESFVGESNVEDIISLYASEGTSASPIKIIDNIFRGGGPSDSGGGIVAGDGHASFTGGWVDILRNTLYNPGQYGTAAAGGHDIRIEENKIYSDRFAWSNNPLFVWNQYAPACSKITIRKNRVNWTNKSGGKDPGGWNGGGCSTVINEPSATITKAEMGVPDHLITFLTPAELLQVRAAK